MIVFADREQAGRILAAKLSFLRDEKTPAVVLALPRGGVPVGYEVARALHAPLDVFVVRKVGVPGHEELAMGAIASGGVVIVNRDVVRMAGITDEIFQAGVARETVELARREKEYREGREPIAVEGKVCVVVDDGIATGASMQAAVTALRSRQAGSIIVAAPVASPLVFRQFAGLADAVVCVETPSDFGAVGAWYEDFGQTSDEEVRSLLASATSALSSWQISEEKPSVWH